MKDSNSFFRPAKNILGGYYIPVRNDWNYFIKLRHITEEERKLYEDENGHKILMDSEFLEWYEKIHKDN
ncbi:MAG: hypothetical protein R6U04_02190 [Bacteroidales bacterium]